MLSVYNSYLLFSCNAQDARTHHLPALDQLCARCDCVCEQSFAHGDIIYQRGDHHHCCYFVHKGVVRLEATDGTTETKVSGIVEKTTVMIVFHSKLDFVEDQESCCSGWKYSRYFI